MLLWRPGAKHCSEEFEYSGMSMEHQDMDENEQELPNESTSRQPFSYSTDLYDNLGNGEDTTRRQRVSS